jgi:hypothetical protein
MHSVASAVKYSTRKEMNTCLQDLKIRRILGSDGRSFCDVSELLTLMMEAVNTSETSVNVYQTTRRNSPEDSHVQKFSFTATFCAKNPLNFEQY